MTVYQATLNPRAEWRNPCKKCGRVCPDDCDCDCHRVDRLHWTPFDDLTKDEFFEMVEYCEKELKELWRFSMGDWYYFHQHIPEIGLDEVVCNFTEFPPQTHGAGATPLLLAFQWVELLRGSGITIRPVHDEELGWEAINRHGEVLRITHRNPHYLGFRLRRDHT